jgi:hypothetical protein
MQTGALAALRFICPDSISGVQPAQRKAGNGHQGWWWFGHVLGTASKADP